TAASTEGWGRPKERKLPRGPHHHLLTHGGQVDREEGEVEQELDEVVSVSHRVHRVLERTGESEDACGNRGIDWNRAPGQRSRAQRGNVRAAAALRKTEVVPDQGPDVGEQVVTQRQ